MKYQVALAGEDKWTEVFVDVGGPERAGEFWAAAHWDSRTESYELDVRDEDGLLFAVTVDVDVDVSFFGMSTKHPCAGPDGKESP